jgi:hypothetical protein
MGRTPWVVQESGYALKAIAAKRKMILFRERDVELPSLQGDLEYIEFDVNDFTRAFQKASEMINGLLAEASGTVVETVVSSTPPSVEPEAEGTPARLQEQATPAIGIRHYYLEIRNAIIDKEWDRAKEAYEKGVTFVAEKVPNMKILWEATYHRLRCSGGQADGFEALQTLAEVNPDAPDPLSAISICLYHFQEYEKSADYALKAARLAHDDDALGYLVSAAKALRKAKKLEEALKLLLEACREPGSRGASDMRLRKELYALLKDKKNSYVAFAVAEWTLQENPGDGDFRFSLAYDYEDEHFDDLSLFHYLLLRENDPNYENVLNNLGVSYSKLKLPILSVDSYWDAYRNGNTLAADNLARGYLQGGFTSDAAKLIKEAMQRENYEPKLPRTLAALDESRNDEQAREKSFLEDAEKHRRFLLAFGEGFLQGTPPLNGTWKLPEADIPLSLADGVLEGETQLTVSETPSGFEALYGAPRESPGTRKIRFTGQVEGRTCKFRLTSETVSSGPLRSIGSLMSAGRAAREGHIVFSPDGTSGEVCDLKDGKPSDFYSISKAT